MIIRDRLQPKKSEYDSGMSRSLTKLLNDSEINEQEDDISNLIAMPGVELKSHIKSQIDSTIDEIKFIRRVSLLMALCVLIFQCLTIAGVSWSFLTLRILVVYNPYQVVLRTFFAAAIFMLCFSEKSII
jgi:CHASE2 domain-containing sensor protein